MRAFRTLLGSNTQSKCIGHKTPVKPPSTTKTHKTPVNTGDKSFQNLA